MGGPQYTVKDLFYYGGLMGGIAITYVALTPTGWHNLIKLGAGLVVGIGLGWAGEKLYDSFKGNNNDPNSRFGPPDQ